MENTVDTVAEHFREYVRARALGHVHARVPLSSKAVRRGALLFAVLLHLILALWIHFATRLQPTDDGDRIEVRLLNAPPTEPSLPEPPSAPLRANVPSSTNQRTVEVPISPPPPPRTDVVPQQEVTLHLFNADGSVAIPRENTASHSTSAPGNTFISTVVAPSPLLQTRRPIKLRPNHFASMWRTPANENLLGTALRKTAELVDEKLTVRKEFTTPWGSKVKCQASYMLVMALAGCGWGIPPKPYEPEERWKPATVLDEE